MTVCRLNCITPPFLLRRLLESDDARVREAALNTLVASSRLRGLRESRAGLLATTTPTEGRRSIFDARHRTTVTGAILKRSEGAPKSSDVSVNQAYDGLGATRDFYRDVLQRDSIDGRGMSLNGYVHRGRNFNNAFWDGKEMVFGDGDGVLFTDFTASLDVIGHELTHGVTEFTAGLEYHDQPGALNEHISDTFGSVVKQWSLKQTADEADWLIGAEVFTPGVQGDALRSMKAPGTAYDNPQMGKDPQPATMADYQHLPNTPEGDDGGVHINSGIPNKAFYLVASGIGGNSWEAPAHIWYESLKASTATTDFQAFADTTVLQAGRLYGVGGAQQQAVQAAWAGVGITVAAAATAPAAARG
jgi:Zn-dependent metalloprotease